MARGLKKLDYGSWGIVISIAKTKALISCAVTVQRICFFVFAYAKSRFSHNEAHMTSSQFINVMHGVYFLQGIGIPQGVE